MIARPTMYLPNKGTWEPYPDTGNKLLPEPTVTQFYDAVSKIVKNIYKSDAQVTPGFYGHFSCLQVLDS